MSESPEARLESAELTDQALDEISESLEAAGESLQELIDNVSQTQHPIPHALLNTAMDFMRQSAKQLEDVNMLNHQYAAEASKELEERGFNDAVSADPVADRVKEILAELGVGESAVLVIRKTGDSETSDSFSSLH